MLFVVNNEDKIFRAAFIVFIVDIVAVVAPQISVNDVDVLITLGSFIREFSSDCHERQLL